MCGSIRNYSVTPQFEKLVGELALALQQRREPPAEPINPALRRPSASEMHDLRERLRSTYRAEFVEASPDVSHLEPPRCLHACAGSAAATAARGLDRWFSSSAMDTHRREHY